MKSYLLPLAVLMAVSMTVAAAEYIWINPAGGDWTNAANWQSTSGGYPELPGDVVTFTNMDVNITVDVADFSSVTCGVIQCGALAHTVNIIGGNMNRTHIVLTNDSGPAGILVNEQRASSGMSFVFNVQNLHFEQPTRIVVQQASGIQFSGNNVWVGDSVVTTRNEGVNNQYIRMYNNESPNFTGEVVVDEGDLFFRSSISIVSARVVRAKANTLVLNRQTTTYFPVLLENGGRYHLTGNGPGGQFGDIMIEGEVEITTDNILTLPGTVSGTGTVAMTGSGGTALYVGEISPGASAGIITFNENAGTLLLGTPGTNVLLSVEVTGSGGVPGVDYDQVLIENLDVALDLANLDVAFSGIAPANITNWFLVGNSIDLTSDFASVDYGGASGLIVKEDNFDASNDRVGVILIPEPTGAMLGVLLLLALRRVRKR